MKTHKFSELLDKIPPERRADIEERVKQLRAEMPLNELRAARDLTQQQLAQSLNVNQAVISRLERRADMYVSTLRNIITAMGGTLEIRAVFPEGPVIIRQFREIAKPEEP